MFKKHKLGSEFSVSSLVNAYYYQLDFNFYNLAESDDIWSLIFVVRGEITVQTNSSRHILKNSEFIFKAPKEHYSLRAYEDSKFYGRQAYIFVLSFVCDSPSMSSFSGRILFSNGVERSYLTQLYKEVEATYDVSEDSLKNPVLRRNSTPSFGSEQMIRAYIEMLLVSICRRNESISIKDRIISANTSKRKEEITQNIILFLNKNISQKITLDQIAKAQNLSASMIRRTFKEQTGLSVIAYLSDLRITEAKRMIRSKDYNFTQISELLGFDNVHYFSTQFKKYTKMTPTQYYSSILHPENNVKTHHVPFSPSPPNWSDINSLDVSEINWGADTGVVSNFQIVWNDDSLCCHAWAKERNIKASIYEPNSDVWLDSCLEFYFKPEEKDPRYFNFEINPNGAIYIGLGTGLSDRLRFLVGDEKTTFHIRTNSKMNEWEVFFSIPLSFIQVFFPEYVLCSGKTIYANCFKSGSERFLAHYMSWNPCVGEEQIFHNSDSFGIFKLC